MTTSSKEQFLALIGGFPDRLPLDTTVHESDSHDDIVRHRVSFQVIEGDRIEAYLLIPRTAAPGRRPAVVAVHQDGGVRPYRYGKSEVAGLGGDPALCYGKDLCERGYVVICPDRFGYESRSLKTSPHRKTFEEFAIQRSTGEFRGVDLTEDLFKGAYANKLLFDGWSMLGRELFEITRAIDLLTTMAEVDGERIGIVGHSAGGLLSAYGMYIDDRLRVGGASCGTWLFHDAFQDDYLRPMQGFGTSLAVPGMNQWGDTNVVLAGLAPRPFIERAGDLDPGEEPQRLIGDAQRRYSELNAAERFDYAAVGGGHGFTGSMKRDIYDWFDWWL